MARRVEKKKKQHKQTKKTKTKSSEAKDLLLISSEKGSNIFSDAQRVFNKFVNKKAA